MYFYNEMKAAYYDCDQNNRLKISAMMRYMQQTSSEQLASLGQSVEWMWGEGMAFILAKSNIVVFRNPICSEIIRLGTAATRPVGPRFIREFVLESGAGERLAACYSLWVLVDMKSRRILRPSVYPHSIDWQEPRLLEEVGDIEIPKKVDEGKDFASFEREIWYSHIDNNGHVNNSVYADFITDALPYRELAARGISRLALSFQKEAMYGERLKIERQPAGEAGYKVVGRKADGVSFEGYIELGLL